MYNNNGQHIGELKVKDCYVVGEGAKHPDGKIYKAYQKQIKYTKKCPTELFNYMKQLINNKPQVEIEKEAKFNNIIEENI